MGGYGLGTVRNLNDYALISGMDILKKEVLNEVRATTAELFENVNWEDIPI